MYYDGLDTLVLKGNELLSSYFDEIGEASFVPVGRRPSPFDFWCKAMEYFENALQKRWTKEEAIKSGLFVGTKVKTNAMPALTYNALTLFVGVSLSEFRRMSGVRDQTISDDLDAKLKLYEPIIEVCRTIIDAINIEGASVGVFNNNLISALAEIKTKVEVSGDAKSPIVVKQITGMTVV